jgi:endonuclease VIII
MPEGDILRRTAAALDRALAGQVLVRGELRWPTVAGVELVGRTVLETLPYGKHLFTRFDDARSLHTHLRMEGSWRVVANPAPASAQAATVRAVLGSAERTAIGDRLGMVDVVRTADERSLIAHLGPDLLADDFPSAGLAAALERWAARSATPVVEVLLDQTVAAGIGTIYAAESLYARGIWPWTPADAVSDPASLLMTARSLMQRSVGAATPTATGETARGRTTRVHGRTGLPCRRCGTPIRRGTARKPPQERPVWFCPVCQRTGDPGAPRSQPIG